MILLCSSIVIPRFGFLIGFPSLLFKDVPTEPSSFQGKIMKASQIIFGCRTAAFQNETKFFAGCFNDGFVADDVKTVDFNSREQRA